MALSCFCFFVYFTLQLSELLLIVLAAHNYLADSYSMAFLFPKLELNLHQESFEVQ